MKEWFEQNKPRLAWTVVVLAIIVAMFLGVTYPIPPAPVETPQFKVQPTGALYPVAQEQMVVQTLVVRGTQIPLPTATAQPTPTPGILYGNTPAAVMEICKTVNVIGQATVTFPGITTPQAVGPIELNNSALGNADYARFDKASGVVTIYTYRLVAQTPVAATTVVAVDVCAKGN